MSKGQIPWNKGMKGIYKLKHSGQFKKGFVPWNKGKTNIYSQKTLNKMKNIKKGKHYSPKTEFKKGQKPTNGSFKKGHKPIAPFKKGHIPWIKGKKHSKEAIRKIRNARIGKPSWSKGKKCPQLSGINNPAWKGGKRMHSDGYVLIYKPNHPFCAKDNYVFEHRLIIEQYLKRFLKSNEVVHHINEIRTNNQIENLMVFKNQGFHRSFHRWKHYNTDNIIFDGSKIHSNAPLNI